MSAAAMSRPALHAELESLLAHWFVKCDARQLPSRAMLGDCARWQDHIAQFDIVQYGALRIYECRSASAGMAARLGDKPLGLSTDELAPDIRGPLRAGFQQAWERRAPHIAQAPGLDQVRFSDLVLPLSDNGRNIDAMLLASYAV